MAQNLIIQGYKLFNLMYQLGEFINIKKWMFFKVYTFAYNSKYIFKNNYNGESIHIR